MIHLTITSYRVNEFNISYFNGVEILDRANTIKKLELKEMLCNRKFNLTLNKQLESELFTSIINNVKLVNSITSDGQRYH